MNNLRKHTHSHTQNTYPHSHSHSHKYVTNDLDFYLLNVANCNISALNPLRIFLCTDDDFSLFQIFISRESLFLCLYLYFDDFSCCRSQRATNRNSASKKPYTKSKNTVDGRHSRINRESTVGNSISSRSNRSNQANSEWKSTVMQRKKLENSTNAAAQQQCKIKATGPTSPTEATIAPIYYNGNTNDSRNGEFLFCVRVCVCLLVYIYAMVRSLSVY